MSNDHFTPLLPCPVCGAAPEVVNSHINWNVKCTTPDCLGYLHDDFLTRLDTTPEEPATAVMMRWNAWISGAPVEAKDFLKKFFALPFDQRGGAARAITRILIANLEEDHPDWTPDQIEEEHQRLVAQYRELVEAPL